MAALTSLRMLCLPASWQSGTDESRGMLLPTQIDRQARRIVSGGVVVTVAGASMSPKYLPYRGGSFSTSTWQRRPIYLLVRWRSRCTWAARTPEPQLHLAIANGAVAASSASRPGETAELWHESLT